MAVEIRPIVLEDAASYRRCWDAIAKERRYLTEYIAPPLAEVQSAFRHYLRTKIPFLVAVDGARVVGFAVVYRPDLPSRRHLGDFGMGLLPQYRELGLGTKLITGVLKLSLGKFESVVLTVFRKNKRAINLYEKMGFKPDSGLKKFMKLADGFDDLIYMQKQIVK